MRRPSIFIPLFLIVLIPVFLFADTVGDYMKARTLMSQASNSAKAGRHEEAKAQYHTALEKLRDIQKKSPTWEPDSINGKIQTCLQQIQNLDATLAAANTPAKKESPVPPPSKTSTPVKTSPPKKPTPPSTDTASAKSTPSTTPSTTVTAKKTSPGKATSPAKTSTPAKPAPAKSTAQKKTSSYSPPVNPQDLGRVPETDSKLANLETVRTTRYDPSTESIMERTSPRKPVTPAPVVVIAPPPPEEKIPELPAPAPSLRKSETVELVKENTELRERLNQLKKENQEGSVHLQTEVKELQSRLQKSREEAVALQKERREQSEQQARLQKNLDETSAEFHQYQKQVQARMKEFSAENSGLKTELTQSQSELRELLAKNQSEIRELRQGLDDSRQKLAGAATDKSHEEQFRTLSGEQQTFGTRLGRMEDRLGDISGRVEEFKTLKDDITRTTSEMESLKNKASSPESSITEQDLKKVSGENEALREKLARLESGIQDLRSSMEDIQRLKTDMSHTRERMETLQKENESLLKAQTEAPARTSPPDSTLVALRNENESLREKLSHLESSMEGINSNLHELKSLKEQVAQSHEKMDAIQKENESLRTRPAIAPPTVSENTEPPPSEKALPPDPVQMAEIEKLRVELDQSQAKLKNLQTENESLRKQSESVTPPPSVLAEAAAFPPEPAITPPSPKDPPTTTSSTVTSADGIITFSSTSTGPNEPTFVVTTATPSVEISPNNPPPAPNPSSTEPPPSATTEPPAINREEAIKTAMAEATSQPTPQTEALPMPQAVESTPTEQKSVPPITVFSKYLGKLLGEVVIRNAREQFVVLSFYHSPMPPENIQLKVLRNGIPVGALRVTSPSRPPFIAADIIQGEVMPGDVVQN